MMARHLCIVFITMAALMAGGCRSLRPHPAAKTPSPRVASRPSAQPAKRSPVIEPVRLPSPPPSPPSPPPQRPTPPPAPEPEALSFEAILGLQVGLDRRNFSPGCLDGRPGPQTRTAMEAWQLAAGEDPGGKPTQELATRLAPASPLTTYTVTPADHERLTPFPDSWRVRASMDRLGYATILEFAAERFHTSEACLRQLNPSADWPNPPPGTSFSAPDPGRPPRPSITRIKVDLDRKFVRGYDSDGRLVAHFPCSIPRLVEKRPRGQARVVNAAENPVYTFDPAIFPEEPEAALIQRKLLIPPGPNNPVGLAWIGLNLPGYGLHGTPHPEDIGLTQSHGCIRLANWNALKLLRMIRHGALVHFAGRAAYQPDAP